MRYFYENWSGYFLLVDVKTLNYQELHSELVDNQFIYAFRNVQPTGGGYFKLNLYSMN